MRTAQAPPRVDKGTPNPTHAPSLTLSPHERLDPSPLPPYSSSPPGTGRRRPVSDTLVCDGSPQRHCFSFPYSDEYSPSPTRATQPPPFRRGGGGVGGGRSQQQLRMEGPPPPLVMEDVLSPASSLDPVGLHSKTWLFRDVRDDWGATGSTLRFPSVLWLCISTIDLRLVL
jgi:hypothetical protein